MGCSSNTALAPGSHSFLTKRIGPLPTCSLICLKGSVAAIRAGMIKQHGVAILPSASSIFGNGRRRDQRKVRSSTTASSFSTALIIWPMGSRAAQRRILATASVASTGSPS